MKTATTTMLLAFLLAGCKGQVEKEFMSGCRSSGASTAKCSCIYDKVEDKLQAAEKDMSILQSSAFKEAYMNAIKSCIK